LAKPVNDQLNLINHTGPSQLKKETQNK